MIFVLLGKSSSGKDTIFQQIMKNNNIDLIKIVPYTTRPIRKGETNGVEYNFVSEKEYEEIKEKGIIIEERSYNTVNGLWRYFNVNSNIDKNKNYITIGTLDSFYSFKEYFNEKDSYNVVVPIYIYIDDKERLLRAIHREEKQNNPNYKELCRRYIADEEDFSEYKINELEKMYFKVFTKNNDINKCTLSILDEINKIVKEYKRVLELINTINNERKK